ncbi:MAG TPA: hypothetical protein PLL66_02805 [Bacteroidales bacterium]|nr:hypothetical protein [Bacteroidales bacterium]
MKIILRISSILIFVSLFNSCSINNSWQGANVTYQDGNSKQLQILDKNSSYFTYVKARQDSTSKKSEILTPEKVKNISSEDLGYVSIYFDEDNYGMESWSFGKILSGNTVFLVETKFQVKTCACKTAGKFFHGYFLVAGDKHLKIKTDSKKNVYNQSEVYDFVEKYTDFQLPQGINNLQDLIRILENINN